jgi:hypothetical protein
MQSFSVLKQVIHILTARLHRVNKKQEVRAVDVICYG